VESRFLAFFLLLFCLPSLCDLYHIVGMIRATPRSETESLRDIISWLEREAASLLPAFLGSLSFRRSPCVNKNTCRACLSGEQHPSHVLYGRHNGRRFAVYVPEDLVAEVRRALDNGHALQDLLMQAGPRYVKALKRTRVSATKRKKG
jgi:hypothetical protein